MLKTFRYNLTHGYARARWLIPDWAQHPEYKCFKIIRAFFKVANEDYEAYYDDIFDLCTDKQEDTYVERFYVNWVSLGTDSGKHKGKVFVQDDQYRVGIWSEVSDVLLAHKNEFLA